MLAHGSSNASWSSAFEQMTSTLRTQNPDAELAFMELCEPSLQAVVKAGVAEGYKAFKVLPLFLARGRHLKKDVPLMIEQLLSEYAVSIELLAPIGEHPELRSAIEKIVGNTLAN